MAEVSRRFSPYTYGNDNPLIFIDPDGMYTVSVKGDAARELFQEFNREEEDREKKREGGQRKHFGLIARMAAQGWKAGDPLPSVDAVDADYTLESLAIPLAKPVEWAAKLIQASWIARIGSKVGYSKTSTAVRSALNERIGKRGFTEVGYQFQKHYGRGGAWGSIITEGTTLNPRTFNNAGYDTFQQVWKSPGSFQKVGKFFEKRLPDGRGIRLQQNWEFKGFID